MVHITSYKVESASRICHCQWNQCTVDFRLAHATSEYVCGTKTFLGITFQTHIYGEFERALDNVGTNSSPK